MTYSIQIQTIWSLSLLLVMIWWYLFISRNFLLFMWYITSLFPSVYLHFPTCYFILCTTMSSTALFRLHSSSLLFSNFLFIDQYTTIWIPNAVIRTLLMSRYNQSFTLTATSLTDCPYIYGTFSKSHDFSRTFYGANRSFKHG